MGSKENLETRTLSELELWAKKQDTTKDPLYFDKELTKAQNEMLDDIYMYAQQGSTLKTIAESFGVDLGTLKRYFRTELGVDALRVYEKAKARGQLQTEGNLFYMTSTGKDFSATKFWLERKCHDDWAEPEAKVQENNYILIETCEADA